MIISVLIKHPDMYNTVVSNISAEDFVSNLNRRIFLSVLQILMDNEQFAISALGDDFSPREVGYISKMLNSEFIGDNPKDTLLDCIAVLKKEKSFSKKATDDDDWASQMRFIAENKKGN
jgi:hypothetical protein